MKFDFMANRRTFFTISGILMILALVLFALQGLNYGIDFNGGSIINVTFDEALTENRIREIFGKMDGLFFRPEQIIIQSISETQGKGFIIRYPSALIDSVDVSQTHSRILRELKAAAPYSDETLEVSNVGPTIGAEMRKQGIQAAIISVIGILLYLAYRFEFQSATGSVVALIHDLVITIGFLAIFRVEFDVSVLAALLTILGYSVNDSIVTLDRIRENRRIMRETDFVSIVNDSINQTISRTLNTSLTTLGSLVALLLLGGTAIRGFAITMTFGVIVGTYSSIFITSPVLLYLTGEKLSKRQRRASTAA